FVTFTTEYPFFVRIGESGLNQDNAAVAKLQNLVLPWSSPITINSTAKNIGALAWTTLDAWLMKDNFNLNPQGDFGFYQDAQSYNMAVAKIGDISSAFGAYVPLAEETGEHASSVGDGKIIIIGDANFINDSFAGRYADNVTFMQNIVDFVSLDSDLITIRAKDVSDRPLSEIEDGSKKNIKYFNVFGLTVIVLAFGLTRYYLRKKDRFADDL
ncbi:hypothetical protein COT95_02110, partial [Candidatus Falkowbacteria bacterium CG10_big_fil_rev_8_21_14_0_10_37_6]